MPEHRERQPMDIDNELQQALKEFREVCEARHIRPPYPNHEVAEAIRKHSQDPDTLADILAQIHVEWVARDDSGFKTHEEKRHRLSNRIVELQIAKRKHQA